MNIDRYDIGITGSLASGYEIGMSPSEGGECVKYEDVTWRKDFNNIPSNSDVLIKLKHQGQVLLAFRNEDDLRRFLCLCTGFEYVEEVIEAWQPIVEGEV